MFDIQEFMSGLDLLYQERRIDQLEQYLLGGLSRTLGTDPEAALVILNELIGYYRVTSRHEDMARCADRSLALIEQLRLSGTLNHGTTLLNAATGYRAAGDPAKAEACYQQAQKILEAHITGPDYRLASLHNNMGLLYSQTGRLEQARDHMLKALSITCQLPDTETEQAITYTNLGNVCFSLGQVSETAAYMKKAVEIFERHPESPDPHYPAALSGLGAACFQKGELETAAACFEQALDLIEALFGRTDDWQATHDNLEMVQGLIRRRDALAIRGMNGLQLARTYYEEVGRPMLLKKYPLYLGRMAIGLAGQGSECLGYDDAHSTDHDFGPGFCIWLTSEDYQAIGAALQADYNALPGEWRGFPVRNTTAGGAGRVGVLNMDDFYREFTGYAQAPAADSREGVQKWTRIPPEMLLTAVNGEVFEDNLGEFTRRRQAFAHYPEAARLFRLADALHKMAQAGQYNYGRGRRRKDPGMMYSSLAQFVESAVETGYLLNQRYTPFYKWRFRGMDDFTCANELKALLLELIAQRPDCEGMEDRIEEICGYVRKELQAQGLSDSSDRFLDSQKDEVLRRMQSCLDRCGEPPLPELSRQKQELVAQVVRAEWEQFQQVHNEGGRAGCQNNWPTFQLMRKSQFYTWNEETLVSYLGDLQEGAASGWNLIMEKYARMMEHTSPDLYRAFAGQLPPISEQRTRIQEQLIAITMGWNSEMQKKYPDLMKMGRSQFSADDGEWDTSSETYLRGELSTYSDATLKLYGSMVLAALRSGVNLVQQTLAFTVHFYGYKSMKEASEACAKELRF